MRRWFALVGAATMLLALLVPAAGATPQDPDVIPGSYIVVLEDGEYPGSVAAEHRRSHNAEVTHVYRHALRGYAAKMTDRAAQRIARDRRVAYVDVDRVVTTAHHQCGHVVRGQEGPCDESPPAEDEKTGTITGTVTDHHDVKIEGATLTVGGTDLEAKSGTDGKYTIAEVPVGEREVTAEAQGYASDMQNVSVEDNTTSALNFSLTPVTTTLQPVPWGVDRVGAPLEANRGGGVHVYVIDTGIDLRHRDLNVADEGFASETCRGKCASDWDDDHGHGTHVAGTVGALDNEVDVVGVAPEVTLHAVKVLAKSGSGSRAGVIAGINYVAGHNRDMARVANMSLGGSGSKAAGSNCTAAGYEHSGSPDAYHEAICGATRAGVVFAVAAGNSGADATGAVPAAYHDTVVTVSATNKSSDWPSWSNWGGTTVEGDWIPTPSVPVAIAAPGVSIESTRASGGTTTMSGTSMAAPHVAGAIAVFLGATSQASDFSAWENARQALVDGAAATGAWSNTSGNPHAEGFLQAQSPPA